METFSLLKHYRAYLEQIAKEFGHEGLEFDVRWSKCNKFIQTNIAFKIWEKMKENRKET